MYHLSYLKLVLDQGPHVTQSASSGRIHIAYGTGIHHFTSTSEVTSHNINASSVFACTSMLQVLAWLHARTIS